MKILTIRFSSLGDVVLISPVTRALSECFPDAETSVAVKQMYEPIAQLLPGVDTVIPFRSDQSFAAYIKTIRQREFDLVIDLHANPRSRILSIFSGAGQVIRYRKRRLARMGMVYRTESPIATRQTVDLYLDTLKSLDIEGHDRLPSLTVHPEAYASISERLRAEGVPFGQPILGIAPGASSAVKRWPAEYFAALADRVLGAQVLAGLGHSVQVAAVAVLLVGALVVLDAGNGHNRTFVTPAEAGHLLDAVGPAPGQEILWHTPQVPWPTWGSAAWGLPPGALATRADVATVSDGDRVVLRLDRLPAFVNRSVADDALAVRAPYAVVTGADLRRHLSSD